MPVCIPQAVTRFEEQVGSCCYMQDHTWHQFASFTLLLNNLHVGLGVL